MTERMNTQIGCKLEKMELDTGVVPAGGSLRLGEQADNPKREGGKRTAQGYTRQRTYP